MTKRRLGIIVGFLAVFALSGAGAIATLHKSTRPWTPVVSTQTDGMDVDAVRRSPLAASNNLRVIKPLEGDPQITAIRAAVEETLDGPPLEGFSPLPADVRLLSVKKEIVKNQNVIITLDFSEELLSNGTGAELEDSLHQLLGAVGNLPGLSSAAGDDSDTRYIEFQVLVNGVKLEYCIEN